MSRQDEIRAQIIAAQAAREAAANPSGQAKKPRPNWAASAPIKPYGRGSMRRGGSGRDR